MDQSVKELIDKLNHSILKDDFEDIAEEVVKKLEKHPLRINAVEPILKLMECHPHFNFGAPGVLTHFVERFYENGYEQKLIESLARKPTEHTVWMLSRIIWGSKGNIRKHYLAVLTGLLKRPDLDRGIITFIQNTLNDDLDKISG